MKMLTGADPKSVLCMYFKQGACSKGAKCKFSHDLAVERKAEKRSLYDDVRDASNKENGKFERQTRNSSNEQNDFCVFPRNDGKLGSKSIG